MPSAPVSCTGKGFVVIAAGSDSDVPHLESIAKEISKFNIPSQIRICSAHKQPGRLQALIEELNQSAEPVMMVGCAGGTDALSGTASYLAKFPVVSCPPEGAKSEVNPTCLTNPPGSSNAYCMRPNNVGKFAAQFFASRNAEVATALDAAIAEKITKLEQADQKLTGGTASAAPAFAAPKGAEMPKGGSVVIAAGSDSDVPHLENIAKELAKFNIPSQIRICSAHKQPGRLQALIQALNESPEPVMMVGCAGGTDALSGTASYLAKFPVISCPPEGAKSEVNPTCLTNPPGSSNAYCMRPNNVAKWAAQFFASQNALVAKALDAAIAEKITKLEQADEQLAKRARAA